MGSEHIIVEFYLFVRFTATSGLCFEASDCNTLPSSSCFILDLYEGTCTCNDAYTSSEDERECLPGKASVIAQEQLTF